MFTSVLWLLTCSIFSPHVANAGFPFATGEQVVMDFEGHNDAEGGMPGLPIMTFAEGNMHEGGMHQEFAYMDPEDGMPDDGQLDDHRDHGGRDQKGGKPRFRGPRGPRPMKEQDYSIRILIPCKMVGAVIGTSGNKIKKITEATNTSIDIHRKEDRREVDKLVTIRGNPEECSLANMQIHKLMRDETDETLRSNEIEIRLVIHDSHAGRIIGRKGSNLKSIMEETGSTSIKVSGNTGDRMGHSSMLNVGDRIVSIKCLIRDGSDGQEPVEEEEALEDCRQAEKRISTKVHDCLKKDMDDLVRSKQMQHPFYPQSVPWNQPPPPYGGQMPPPVVGDVHGGGANIMSPCSHYPQTGHYAHAYQQMQAHDQNAKEIIVRLAIPQKYAGAVIGTKGSFCNYMKVLSQASKVHVSADDKSGERYVEIHGSPLAQYFAQHCVYCKLAEQGYSNSDGELKLRVEIVIPVKGASRGNKETNIIGRIIGKGGQNVKGLEHETRTYVKVATTEDKDGEPEKAIVQIVGSFASSQHAQFRINEIVRLCQQENAGENVGGIPPGSHPGPGKPRPPPHVS